MLARFACWSRSLLRNLNTVASDDAVEQDTRMQDVEGDHKSRHGCTIQSNEISLGLNDVSSPSASKLDRTVNASHDDKKDRERSDEHEKFHVLVVLEGRKAQLGRGSVQEQEEENTEDDDRSQLEVDTSNHDVGADLGVTLRLRVERNSC